MNAILNHVPHVEVLSMEALPNAIDAVTMHATIRTTTFPMMVRSRLNVRRKGGDKLEGLEALIRSQGLLQNLVGFEQVADGIRTGLIEVVAGARRLACIGRLIARGDLPEDFQIPYLLVSEDEAIAISLAENLGREPMHPADVFDAMLELSRRGVSAEDIGIAFGVDALTVRRRLKLANVSPRLVALYRDDEVSFDQMMALAVVDDHEAQEQAWDSLGKWSRQPHQLRRLLTAQHIDVQTDRVARFVGVEVFKKAGGEVVKDLFSDTGAGFITDGALLESLAAAKLERAAKGLAKEGFAWTAVRVRIDASELAAFASVRTVRRQADDSERTKLDALANELEVLDAQIEEAGDDGDFASLYAQQERLEDERRAVLDSLLGPHPADRALAGALVSIDDHGKLHIRRGLIRPEDRNKLEKLPSDAASGSDGKSKTRAVHSERLMTILTAHRTVALHAELMKRADVALVVMTHGLIERVFYRRGWSGRVAKVNIEMPALPVEVESGAAWSAVQERRAELAARLPAEVEGGQTLMVWLLAQPQELVSEFMAFCVGCSLDAIQSREKPAPSYAELAAGVGLDMHAWWRPTSDNYFAHVSKARMVEVVTEAVSKEAAVSLDKMSKAAAAGAAERCVAESGWMPGVLLG